MRRRFLVSGSFVVFLACAAASWGASSLAVNVTGAYHSPMRPASSATHLTDGFGFQLLPELQVNPFLGFGLGITSDYLYRPSGPDMRVGTLDLSARLRKPVQGLKPQPYLQTLLGFNILSKEKNHWRGKTRFSIGVGTRLGLVPGAALDLGVRQVFLSPKPNNLQYLSVYAGWTTQFTLRREGTRTATPTPTATPQTSPVVTMVVTATDTPVVVTPTSTAVKVGKKGAPTATVTSTPTVAVPTTTPTSTLASPVEAKARMLDLYQKGIDAYKAKRYTAAIKDLKGALQVQDPTIPDWYYAEANAMLGVIYHYNVSAAGHLSKARAYYQAALKVDPQTATAKKGLRLLGAAKPAGSAK
jgi:hypothetical protein